MKIVIIDYGFGNLFSLKNAFEHMGVDARIVDSSKEVENARAIILPGVGAFGDGIKGLRDRGFVEPLVRAKEKNVPLLGICLGMQFLFEYSEEFGHHKGLGFIKGSVKKISAKNEGCKIPHIGWNTLHSDEKRSWDNTILRGLKAGAQAYFVHSYAGYPENNSYNVATTEYCENTFSSVVGLGVLWGTQFHPEKSGEVGLKILKNFIAL